jgi:hypothetical protein
MRHQSSDFTENAYLFLGDVQNYHVLLSTVIAQELFSIELFFVFNESLLTRHLTRKTGTIILSIDSFLETVQIEKLA